LPSSTLFAGGASGYFNPSDIAQGVWEWNGQILTQQGYYDYVIKPYEDKMRAKVASDLGLSEESVTPKGDDLDGGNANFIIPKLHGTPLPKVTAALPVSRREFDAESLTPYILTLG